MEKQLPSHSGFTLAQWLNQTIEIPGLCLKLHLRGNNLHLLCEGESPPDRLDLLHRLLPALQKTDLNAFNTPADAPQIYQIQIYGCKVGQTHPVWSGTLYLNQIEAHLAQLQEEIALRSSNHKASTSSSSSPSLSSDSQSPPSTAGKFTLALSNRSLARQGHETAIASYLSETLSDLGIAVRVSVKSIACTVNFNVYSTDIVHTSSTAKRLWIACEASYSPDPLLVGESITQKLRDLEIEGYRDAVIRFQVAGETQPDWLLRVDLTPADEMLREWARWGDLEAIQRLLNQAVAHLGAQFSSATLKEATLHLFCTVMPHSPAAADIQVPNLQQIRTIVVPLLDMLGPQGIHAVTLYGQVMGQDAPAWLDWLELPAASHPALSDLPLTLALQEDWSAIAFLLHRLLNPDLDKYLATGGIRLQLLPKHDLLHIMSEASICPDQRQVGQTIVQFLKQLKLPDISGVRIYGRRAGQKHPLWNYGVDFIARDRLVSEVTPEFAVTDTYLSELVSQPSEDILRPELTPEDIQSAWSGLRRHTLGWLQQALVRSHLFMAEAESTTRSLALPNQIDPQAGKLAIVWGLVGTLLVVQTNWLLEKMLRSEAVATAEISDSVEVSRQHTAPGELSSPTPSTSVVSSTQPVEAIPSSEFPFPELKLRRSTDTEVDTEAFDTQGFTESDPEPTPQSTKSPTAQSSPTTSSTPDSAQPSASALPYTPQNPAVNLALAQSLADKASLPSFNSRQFNDKLELYYRVLEESGGPPDVLVVGSSRALRGVDPKALEQALSELGHTEIKVFNFGINGATAQVIDLLVRQMLTPEQLPRLIIWADGARAFNSNAVDVTYNGITASVAYQELTQGTLQLPRVGQATPSTSSAPGAETQEGINITLTDSYQSLDRWFSQRLSIASPSYKERDRLKHLIQQRLTSWLPPSSVTPSITNELIASDSRVPLSNTPATLPANYEFVDADGFLSLGVQFNPATYYQKYAKVPGDYDRDYNEFQIAGVQETALLSLLSYTQTQKVPIVFVNLPLTDEYLDAARTGYEEKFRQFMVGLSLNQPGFKFHDLGGIWTTEYDYFSDPSHLNRYGAYAVSHRIATDPRITWTEQEVATEEKTEK